MSDPLHVFDSHPHHPGEEKHVSLVRALLVPPALTVCVAVATFTAYVFYSNSALGYGYGSISALLHASWTFILGAAILYGLLPGLVVTGLILLVGRAALRHQTSTLPIFSTVVAGTAAASLAPIPIGIPLGIYLLWPLAGLLLSTLLALLVFRPRLLRRKPSIATN